MTAPRSGSEIPVVDFTALSADVDDHDVNVASFAQPSREIYEAFSTVGFVYLKNTGISDEQVKHVTQCSARFFTLSDDIKKPYALDATVNHGWVGLDRTRSLPGRPSDLREAFSITPSYAKVWPEQEVPGFKSTLVGFHQKCGLLASRVLKAMAIGLGLEDQDFFNKAHTSELGQSTLRCQYYPRLDPNTEIKPNQLRLSEHCDLGSITLVFQDDVGGLEVLHRNGNYVAATPIADTVVVNVGDLMQRWTSDRLVSTKHRVLIPDKESARQVRQSLAFFMRPDDDFVVKCLDGSEKYEPICQWDYVKMTYMADKNPANKR